MSKVVKEDSLIDKSYNTIRQSILDGQTKLIKQVNQALISVYYKVGKEINEIIGVEKRSKYGGETIKVISSRLTKEFGKGFDQTNLRHMRNFYIMFPIHDTLCRGLSWSHYRLLIKVKNKEIRDFYIEECSKSNWVLDS